MLFRLLRLTLIARFRGRVTVWDTTGTTFRVRLRDLDVLRHMTNSAYLAVLDLGRMDLVIRAGLWAHAQEQGIYSVVSGQTITYRRSLRYGQRFRIETRVIGVDDRSTFFQQRITVNGEIHAEAVVRQRFLRRGGGVVPIREMLEWSGPPPDGRTVPDWVLEWADSTRLPSTREPALSTWAR